MRNYLNFAEYFDAARTVQSLEDVQMHLEEPFKRVCHMDVTQCAYDNFTHVCFDPEYQSDDEKERAVFLIIPQCALGLLVTKEVIKLLIIARFAIPGIPPRWAMCAGPRCFGHWR